MAGWSVDRNREVVTEIATFTAGVALLLGAAGVQGWWQQQSSGASVTPPTTSESAHVGMDTIMWSLLVDTAWPGSPPAR